MSFRLHTSKGSLAITHADKKMIIDTTKIAASFGKTSSITSQREVRGIGFAHAFAQSSALA